MNVKFEQIQDIILNNPGKSIIDHAVSYSEKLRLHVHGVGMDKAIRHCQEFSNKDIFKVQKDYALSNVDLMRRLLQLEDMVFSAGGGSVNYGLPENKEQILNAKLSKIRHGMPLRKWVKNVAREAYRVDPYGVIFIEMSQASVDGSGNLVKREAYPTYKSITTIYDYQTNGRVVEWICFNLSKAEAIAFGIQDEKLKDYPDEKKTNYFRFVDDRKDLIVNKVDSKTVRIAEKITQKNPILNPWGRTPAFVVSDIMQYDDSRKFLSPLNDVVELANSFLYDRSIRELQKKFHGFLKAVEPLLTCPECNGQGSVDGKECEACKGTGYKLQTTPKDVAKFPIEILKEVPGFDFSKLFGYVSPDIRIWEKQDTSLSDIENYMRATYYGISLDTKTEGASTSNTQNETATRTSQNWRPVESRLNTSADWAESTENMIVDFIGKDLFPNEFKQSSSRYGRDYVLRGVNEYLEEYMTMRKSGVPDFELDDAMDRYLRALYQNNPIMLAISRKKMQVEPFPHIKLSEARNIIGEENYMLKMYYGEWQDTVDKSDWVTESRESLQSKLLAYVKTKKQINGQEQFNQEATPTV